MEPRWSDLMPELVEAILTRLPAEDYRQVGLVCKSWRSATIKVRCHFKPPPLLFLKPEEPRHLIDLHTSDPAREPDPMPMWFYAVCHGGELRRLNIRPSPTAWCCGSSMGWLFMADVVDTSRVHLLNPASGERVGLPRLPPRATLMPDSDYVMCSRPAPDRGCVVAVYGFRTARGRGVGREQFTGLFTCRPNDRRWGEIPLSVSGYKAAFYDGRLYVSCRDGTDIYDFATGPRKTGSVARIDGLVVVEGLVVVDGILLLIVYELVDGRLAETPRRRVYELVDGRWAEARGQGDWVLLRSILKTDAFSMRERPTSGFEADCAYEPAGYCLRACSMDDRMDDRRRWAVYLSNAEIDEYILTTHLRAEVSFFLPQSW